MNLTSHKQRKPDSIKKIIKKYIFWFYKDSWNQMFNSIFTQTVNNIPDEILKLFSILIQSFKSIFSRFFVQNFYRYQGQKYAIKNDEIPFIRIK